MKVFLTAEVQYCCELSKEDSQKVIQYTKENECSYETAIWELYCDRYAIDLYRIPYEIDFSTKHIDEVELDEKDED